MSWKQRNLQRFGNFYITLNQVEEIYLRWLNRVVQDHEARASDLDRKLIFSFFLLFS